MVFLSNRIIIIFVYTLALCYSQLWSQMLPFAVAEDKQLWVPQLWMIDLCQLLNIPRLGFPLFINEEGIEKCKSQDIERTTVKYRVLDLPWLLYTSQSSLVTRKSFTRTSQMKFQHEFESGLLVSTLLKSC